MKISQQPESYFIEINSLFLRLGMLSPHDVQTKKEIIAEIREEIKKLEGLGFNLDEYEGKLTAQQ